MSRHRVDARRLLCPLPVIRTQDKVAELGAGEELEVLCTDPGALKDIPAWCRINGHQYLGHREEDGVLVLAVRVGEAG